MTSIQNKCKQFLDDQEPNTLVVLDMDQTMVKQHSRGALIGNSQEEIKKSLERFKSSKSEVAEILVRMMVERKMMWGVATFSDARYKNILDHKFVIGGKTLTMALLSSFKVQQDIPMSCWNPDIDRKSRTKIEHIDKIINFYKQQRKIIDKVVLIDDSEDVAIPTKKAFDSDPERPNLTFIRVINKKGLELTDLKNNLYFM